MTEGEVTDVDPGIETDSSLPSKAEVKKAIEEILDSISSHPGAWKEELQGVTAQRGKAVCKSQPHFCPIFDKQ